ncbi:MAG: enoyl-CoA hydratase-related protein [Bacteroidota bacterium]|jgi:enoyl-CoA hydratase
MYEDYKLLKTERRGRVLVVTIDRPPLNASNRVVHKELSRIFFDIAKDDETNVVVLTGAGTAFCAGGDLNEMKKRMEDQTLWAEVMREARDIVLGIVTLDKPIIARVNGPAVGLGATIALLCDIIIAVDTAKIADTHVKIGLVAGDGGSIAWPLGVGLPKAKEYLLTGDPLTATEAARIGLINHALPADQLDARVYGLAERLATGSQQAIRGTKRAINMWMGNVSAVVDAHLGLETLTYQGRDHRIGVDAFLEKKQPQFSTR